MSLDLTTILPNVAITLDGTGFIFGAGTSCEAGYPMMAALTRQVMSGLTSSERIILEDVLNAVGEVYDDAKATPNIEQICDLVIAHWTNSGSPRFNDLALQIEALILKAILAIDKPNLDNHCRFFEALKKRCFGHPCCVWIFTTNYDLLFEVAAARTDVQLENGFCGTTERFFNPEQFQSSHGVVANGKFRPTNHLVVKLIKLHGSISWVEESSKFYERHPKVLDATARRLMVLPRRQKAMDTLKPPHDALFRQARGILGNDCKYLVSCGFSYGDEHINRVLITPMLSSLKCRLFALSQEEPAGLAMLKGFPNFQAGFEHHRHIDGKTIAASTDVWKFSQFVNLFE